MYNINMADYLQKSDDVILEDSETRLTDELKKLLEKEILFDDPLLRESRMMSFYEIAALRLLERAISSKYPAALFEVFNRVDGKVTNKIKTETNIMKTHEEWIREINAELTDKNA